MIEKSNAPNKSTFSRRLIWYILVGLSLYWVSNAMVGLPWVISKTLGIITMMLSTILWGYMAFFCFKHAPRSEWNKDTVFMALSFLITGAGQDYLFFAVYRGVPDELYEFTTFLAYGITFLLPFLIRYVFMRTYKGKAILPVTNKKLIITVIIGIFSFLFTIWSMRFW